MNNEQPNRIAWFREICVPQKPIIVWSPCKHNNIYPPKYNPLYVCAPHTWNNFELLLFRFCQTTPALTHARTHTQKLNLFVFSFFVFFLYRFSLIFLSNRTQFANKNRKCINRGADLSNQKTKCHAFYFERNEAISLFFPFSISLNAQSRRLFGKYDASKKKKTNENSNRNQFEQQQSNKTDFLLKKQQQQQGNRFVLFVCFVPWVSSKMMILWCVVAICCLCCSFFFVIFFFVKCVLFTICLRLE